LEGQGVIDPEAGIQVWMAIRTLEVPVSPEAVPEVSEMLSTPEVETRTGVVITAVGALYRN